MTSGSQIVDEDVGLLAGFAAMLETNYVERDEAWIGSPFAWIKTRPAGQRGKIGEQLVAGWCAAKGLDVGPSTSSQFDKLIHGYRVEVKFSTLWEGGVYKFQQIRDQDYDIVICLGVSPFNAHSWVLPKRVLYELVIGKMGQHGGRAARDTDWITINPNKPESWLAPWGGVLKDAYQVLVGLDPGPYARSHLV